MTTKNRAAGVSCARCRFCDHDLIAREGGNIYCTNDRCRLHRHEHPMGSNTADR